MNRIISLLQFLVLLVPTAALTQDFSSAVKIQAIGVTKINSMLNGTNVLVEISSHEIANGTPSHIDTAATRFTSCTNSRVPCSVVDDIAISVNGKKIFVPRSVFCDLADLDRGALLEGNSKGQMTLILWVGDAAEAYIARIDFDSTRVTRKRISSDLEQKELLQDTRYYIQSFDG